MYRLTRRTAIALDIHPTTISLVISPNRFGASPSLPPPNFLPVLSPSILDCRPTRVSRPPIERALHLRYNFAWAAFISSLSSSRARWRECERVQCPVRGRGAGFFGNTSFFTRESGETWAPRCPSVPYPRSLSAWTWPRS